MVGENINSLLMYVCCMIIQYYRRLLLASTTTVLVSSFLLSPLSPIMCLPPLMFVPVVPPSHPFPVALLLLFQGFGASTPTEVFLSVVVSIPPLIDTGVNVGDLGSVIRCSVVFVVVGGEVGCVGRTTEEHFW